MLLGAIFKQDQQKIEYLYLNSWRFMKLELKETMELVKALELIGVKGKEILKDGIDSNDIVPAIELLKEINVIVEGIKDVKEIGAEMKDLDQEELLQLGMAMFSLYKKIKEA